MESQSPRFGISGFGTFFNEMANEGGMCLGLSLATEKQRQMVFQHRLVNVDCNLIGTEQLLSSSFFHVFGHQLEISRQTTIDERQDFWRSLAGVVHDQGQVLLPLLVGGGHRPIDR